MKKVEFTRQVPKFLQGLVKENHQHDDRTGKRHDKQDQEDVDIVPIVIETSDIKGNKLDDVDEKHDDDDDDDDKKRKEKSEIQVKQVNNKAIGKQQKPSKRQLLSFEVDEEDEAK